MRVLCIRLVDASGEPARSSSWLSLYQEYIVRAVEAYPQGRLLLRVLGDDERTPGLYRSDMFLTTSPHIPSNWVARVGDEGSLDLSPEKWLRPSFWEDYFAGVR